LTPPDRPSRTHPFRYGAGAAFLLAYFIYFNWGSLNVHFAIDDLGNMAHYYRGGWRLLLISQFRIWHGDYRPMGGLFYVPIFHFAGLNPVPYQAVLLVLLLANVYWVYRFARLLGAGELAAALAALAVCYHAGLANLYYNAAFVYDVLCCFFYLAAFVYYMRIRNSGRLLGTRQTLIFMALFLCALNSKEMAVTIPVMLAVYEWIYHRPKGWNRAELLAWLRGPARVALFASGLNLIDIYGKLFGPDPLTAGEGYRPVFAIGRVRAFQRLSYQDLFMNWDSAPGWGGLLAAWVLMAYLAWRRADRPALRFLFWFLVVAPLPIEFLVGKSQACLALLMIGLAVYVAIVLVDLANAIARLLCGEPLFRLLGSRVLAGLLIAWVVYYWAHENRHLQTHIVRNSMASLGEDSWDIIQQLRALDPHARPGSRVAFLDDPFHSFDMHNIAELWIHDRSVDVHVMRDGPLTPEELARRDQVFTFENRKLIRLR